MLQKKGFSTQHSSLSWMPAGWEEVLNNSWRWSAPPVDAFACIVGKPWCSSYYYCATSFQKWKNELPWRIRYCQQCDGNLQRWEPLLIFQAGNKAWYTFVAQSFLKKQPIIIIIIIIIIITIIIIIISW